LLLQGAKMIVGNADQSKKQGGDDKNSKQSGEKTFTVAQLYLLLSTHEMI